MNRLFVYFFIALSCVSLPTASSAKPNIPEIVSPHYKTGLIRHIVLFRYKDSVTAPQKREVIKRFLALKYLARRDGEPYIVSIDTGKQNSGEGASQGLEQGFIVTFKSQGDRNYYVGTPVVTNPAYFDPAHQKFKNFVGPLLDKNGALVFDYKIEQFAK